MAVSYEVLEFILLQYETREVNNRFLYGRMKLREVNNHAQLA